MLNNRLIVAIWRTIAVFFSLTGIIIIFALANDFWRTLSFFTIQTNLFVLLHLVLLLILTYAQIFKNGIKGKCKGYNSFIQLAIVLFITITFTVFATFLSNVKFNMGGDVVKARWMSIGNRLVHYIVPVMVIIDWFFFIPHGKIKFNKAFILIIYPLAYYAIIIIRAIIGPPIYKTLQGVPTNWPYPFLDFSILGWKIPFIVMAFVGFILVLGFVFIFFDKILAPRNARITKNRKIKK